MNNVMCLLAYFKVVLYLFNEKLKYLFFQSGILNAATTFASQVLFIYLITIINV